MAGQQKRLSPQDRLLLCVTVSCVLFGSAAGLKYEKKCIGSSMTFSQLYSPPGFKGKMYFTPSRGGPRELVMDYGKLKDPRLARAYSAVLSDLTERDDGTFSVAFLSDINFSDDFLIFDIIRLKILDCSDKVTVIYGSTYSSDVPLQAEFLEYNSLYTEDQPKVLWNHTDPQTNNRGRVQVTHDGRLWEIHDLTPADSGHYSLRAKDNTSLKGTLLEVTEHISHYNAKVNEGLFIEYAFRGPLWTVTFTRKGGSSVTLYERNTPVRYRPSFPNRVWREDGGLQIADWKSGDSGTIEFRDRQGNLAQSVEVEVEVEVEDENEDGNKFVENVGITVGISFAVTVCICCCCCCCCKKICDNKSSSKRDVSTLPVFYHDSTQPAGPSYSAAPAPHHSYQPIHSFVPTEPTAAPLEPSVHYPVHIYVNPPQPEVAALREQNTDPAPSLGPDCLSSDPGPQFELKKGLSSPSAPFLSSDPTFNGIYTSDKPNFL
ncbi:uncharacterized protein LOC131985291 [Centropristis striata]|uniref:uncharacterized protein LOC131985291 n=1 Tax=Centropristis striata TaxID=184440 RepID=UPI0027E06539|nr:uncharacterized protein LOC131985291 [Centropristis striata]